MNVDRSDLLDNYLGRTKTNLLKNIQEIISNLVVSPTDTFGKEALDCLKRNGVSFELKNI